ncbi:J domain-containing protein [Dankookia rubra]|uniref:J domain-containing protein n=1 Tax=Dankookia rubra TaxID=1442381 RepID=A0A4R5QHQ1_9PROT|nr:DnaJ C-terminal domain-containing protein [Dankookia rubra]TDH62503.1 J domain-containing protein [Dankookia rubra]
MPPNPPPDPYATLGLARDATAEQVRAAFRKLAKQHHPDLNPGNKAAEDRFKAINAAHDLLSDPETRGRFDRGEIDAAGDPVAPEPPRYHRYADAAAGGRYRPGAEEDDPFGDIFSDLFRRGGGGTEGLRIRGADARYALAVDFLDGVTGATRTLTLPDGRTLDVRIPPGIETGQTLRLKGQGGPGLNGGPSGDALIEIELRPHPLFTREGDDIRLELPVTLKEAVLGARVTVPTPTGAVSMAVPPHSDTGTKLRLRGRGVAAHAGRPAGDLYVTLRVTLAGADAALEAFLRDWAPANPIDPRRDMEGA